MLNRRDFLRTGGFAGAYMLVGGQMKTASGETLMDGLSDPALQPKFVNLAPNAADPGFMYDTSGGDVQVGVARTRQWTGLRKPNGRKARTTCWGYGDENLVSWPGRTFEARSGVPLKVHWENNLHGIRRHLLPVDKTNHWAYSQGPHGVMGSNGPATIRRDGVPIVPHLHGGHTRDIYDGNPEFWFSPGAEIVGPRFATTKYIYDNDQVAGTLWYHDHALGITRLNVYAGLAGFYLLRDDLDTGRANNPLGLPAAPYELAYAIQDRMFRNNGRLFYPAFPGEPAYDDFITDEGAVLPPDLFPNGGPTGLAEFFGDHMLVNGMIWPKENVERRHYRMRLLNGCDSRFLAFRFRPTSIHATDLDDAGAPLPFHVIGTDQGLGRREAEEDILLIAPGERYDIVVDFTDIPLGTRVIMENVAGDAPFGGDIFPAAEDLFEDRQTDRIMAFDVVKPLDTSIPDRFDPRAIRGIYERNTTQAARVRKVALFEGKDQFGRLQPMVGTAGPSEGADGLSYDGALTWTQSTTENPGLGDTELWDVYNSTGDSHPIHLHLVNFDVRHRQAYTADVVEQPAIQHDGAVGIGFRLENIVKTGPRMRPPRYEIAPKDTVVANPGEVTRIKATFDRPGRYVWHCHILSHEDHEMMRVLHVGPDAE